MQTKNSAGAKGNHSVLQSLLVPPRTGRLARPVQQWWPSGAAGRVRSRCCMATGGTFPAPFSLKNSKGKVKMNPVAGWEVGRDRNSVLFMVG